MGKSAKLHKRVPKKLRSSTTLPATSTHVQHAKKKAALKDKTDTAKPSGHVLGGADYVSLMLGGRKKAKEESFKLPPSQD